MLARDRYYHERREIGRMLTGAGFTLVSADYHTPPHGTYLLRQPKHGEQS